MSVKERYALTDEGAKNIHKAIVATVLGNLAAFAGAGILLAAIANLAACSIDDAPLPQALPYLGALAVFAVIMFFAQKAQYHFTYATVYGESARQRMGIAERLRKLPLSFFSRRDIADLTETIMGDVTAVERVQADVLPELYGAVITLGIAACGMAAVDWRLALAALWSAPVAFAMLFALRGVVEPLTSARRSADLAVASDVQEALECVREVRATNQKEHYLERIRAHIAEAEAQTTKGEIAMGLLMYGAQVVLRAGLATTVLAGAVLIAAGEVDFFVLIAFLLVVSRLYAPFDQCLMGVTQVFGSQVSAKRLKALYEEPVATGGEAFEPMGHDIAFEDVGFSYSEDDGEVLNGVSFTAREGEVTALVGPSGSGKSTCARLACRFWDAKSGRVTVGGVDVSSVEPEILLRDFAVVFQDVVLFDATVMDNIRLGRRGASDDEVLAAARAANCDEFASRMPEGYQTMIGENGSKLSGGERQRLSIARALLKDAAVVILDEATASLDSENETLVQEAIGRLCRGKTVIVIAHRLRTVVNANRIVVLDEGRVVEQGGHDELLAKGGLYARLWSIQRQSSSWTIAAGRLDDDQWEDAGRKTDCVRHLG